VYTVNATGSPTRALDMDVWAEVPGSWVTVQQVQLMLILYGYLQLTRRCFRYNSITFTNPIKWRRVNCS
jgi:hypothetical protein